MERAARKYGPLFFALIYYYLDLIVDQTPRLVAEEDVDLLGFDDGCYFAEAENTSP